MGRSEATGTGVAAVVTFVVVLSFAGVIVGLDGSGTVPARSDAVVEPGSETQIATTDTTAAGAVRSVPVGSAGPWDSAGISGRVTDEDGEPIFNATVAVNGTSRKTTTAADGYYDLDLPEGTHEIVIVADGYQAKRATVSVSSNERVNLDPTLTVKPTRVVGTVTGENETPLENATVTVVDTSTETVTDADGSYVLEIDAGTYVLEASADGYDDWQTAVSVSAHQTVERNFTLTVPGSDENDETDGSNESDAGSEPNESDDESNHPPGNESNESPTETAPGNESTAASSDGTEPQSESDPAASDPLSIREQLHYLLLLACLFLAVLVTTTVAGLYWNRTYEP